MVIGPLWKCEFPAFSAITVEMVRSVVNETFAEIEHCHLQNNPKTT